MHELFIRSPIEASASANATPVAAAGTVIEEGGSMIAGQPPVLSPAPPYQPASFWYLPPTQTDELTRRQASYRILRLLIRETKLRAYMSDLMSAVSDDGLTPFMVAIQCKAYQVATFLLDFLIVSCIIVFKLKFLDD